MRRKKNKLQVHPYKPVFWFPTHQGITGINCIIVGLNVYILLIFNPLGLREMLIFTIWHKVLKIAHNKHTI